MTLSPPVRVLAVVGALAATGLAAFLFLLGRTAGEAEPATQAVRPTFEVEQPATPATTPASPAPRTRPPAASSPLSGYPTPVRRALRAKRLAVVVVYTPGSSVDAFVRAEARAGAAEARAAFVAIRASSERAVRALVAKTGVLPSPAIVVVRRPGVVVSILGISDRELVAQAVAQGR